MLEFIKSQFGESRTCWSKWRAIFRGVTEMIKKRWQVHWDQNHRDWSDNEQSFISPHGKTSLALSVSALLHVHDAHDASLLLQTHNTLTEKTIWNPFDSNTDWNFDRKESEGRRSAPRPLSTLNPQPTLLLQCVCLLSPDVIAATSDILNVYIDVCLEQQKIDGTYCVFIWQQTLMKHFTVTSVAPYMFIITFVWMHSVSYALKYVNFSDEHTDLYVPPLYVNMKYAFLHIQIVNIKCIEITCLYSIQVWKHVKCVLFSNNWTTEYSTISQY